MKVTLEIKNPDVIKNIEKFKRDIEESLLLFDDVRVLLPWESKGMTKEEALAFAKKYLADRRDQWTTAFELADRDYEVQKQTKRVWDVCVEYVLNDIIPYLYGEALD